MREAQGEARRRRRRTCTSGDTGCRAVSCSIWPCLRTRWPARITVSAGCRRRSRRAAVRGRAWLQRGGHAVQARVEGSMIAPGAERRRRTWQRSASLVKRASAALVAEKPHGRGRVCACLGATSSALCGSPGVAPRTGPGTEHRGALEAGGLAPCGRPGGVPQAHAAHQEAVGFRVETRARAWRLPLASVQPGGPVPAAQRAGFADGQPQ